MQQNIYAENLMEILLQFITTFSPKDIIQNVICAHMVDYCKPGHVCMYSVLSPITLIKQSHLINSTQIHC